MTQLYYSFNPGATIFGPPAPPTTEEQNKKLRTIALDNLAKELENIQRSANHHSAQLEELAGRAARAVTQLREVRPLLPAGNSTGKKRKKR